MKRRLASGVLIAEAVIAAFLMLFAFAASTLLFDASLRWEGESGSAHRAAMVADKKMEELRALAAEVPSQGSFVDRLASLVGPQDEYPEAPGLAIDVQILDNISRPIPTSNLTPVPGVHSPCSGLFTKIPSGSDNPPDNNPQLNNQYETYPYSRHLRDSLQLVQVTVTYGPRKKKYNLISLLGDPITPFAPTPKVEVKRVSGSSTLSNTSSVAVYEAQVVTKTGSHPRDVTILWGLSLESTGSLVFLPLDSSGRQVQVKRSKLTPPGSSATARVKAVVRYGGQEASGKSEEISLP